MFTPEQYEVLEQAHELVKSWGKAYWKAMREGTLSFPQEVDGEDLSSARDRWKALVASVHGEPAVREFAKAAGNLLMVQAGRGRAEREGYRDRTFEAGILIGETQERCRAAEGELQRALYRVGRPPEGQSVPQLERDPQVNGLVLPHLD